MPKKIDLRYNPIICECKNINHIQNAVSQLRQNNQRSILKGLQLATCDNLEMNVLEAANWCANDKKMESNNKQKVKDMEKDKSNTDIIP